MKTNLKSIRISKRIRTQTQLAKLMSESGVLFTRQAVSLIESGANIALRRTSAECISRILGESIEDIFPGMKILEYTPNWNRHCKNCGVVIFRKVRRGEAKTLLRHIENNWCSEKCFYHYIKNNPTSRLTFTSMRADFIKSSCEICGSTKSLLLHHIDFNWENNDPSNFQTLCRGCHNRLHAVPNYKHKIDKNFEYLLKGKPKDKCFICGRRTKRDYLCMKHYHRLRKTNGNPFVYLGGGGSGGQKGIYYYDNIVSGEKGIPIGRRYPKCGKTFAKKYLNTT